MSEAQPSRWWVTGADDERAPGEIVTETVVGWRAWHVVRSPDGPELVSWWLNTLWQPRRRLEAACERHGPRPDRAHDCGIHAFKTFQDTLAYVGHKVPYVGFPFVRPVEGRISVAVGRVSMWGHVVEHRNGYRSQFGYPYELILIGGDEGVARDLARRYAVDTLPELRELVA